MKLVSPPVIFLLNVPMRCFFCGYLLLFVFVIAVSGKLVVVCWERADFLAPLYLMFSCVFVTFPYGVLGQVCYLIVIES